MVSRDSAREFERLYRDNYRLVYNYVSYCMAGSPAAEDVVADAFMKAARNFDQLDLARAKFSTWVISIARNCAVDYWRKNKVAENIDNVPEGAYAQVADHAEQSCDADLAVRLLATLELDERELVYKKYFEGKGNAEIAAELDMNPSTVGTRLQRALQRMRKAAEDM